MKPLRTGLAAGLLAGGAAAANKLVSDWRGGAAGMTSTKVVTGSNGKGPAKGGALGGVTEAVGGAIARRAAKRAEANRPPWVVAPVPGASAGLGMGGGPATVAAAPSRPMASRPAAAAARKLPSLESLKPPSAKSVGASVGKYAVKQAGKAIGKAAADRVGKAIEVIETLEKVVAAASSESAAKPDLTPSGPGSVVNAVPVTASQVSSSAHPGLADADPVEAPTKPRGTLVSVRKFERGPRVVVGPGVKQPEPDPSEPTAAGEAAVEAAVEVVVDAVESAVTEAAATTEAAMTEAVMAEAQTTDAPTAQAGATVRPVVADSQASEMAAVKEKPAAKRKPAAKPKTAAKKPAAKRTPTRSKPAGPATDANPPVAGVDNTP